MLSDLECVLELVALEHVVVAPRIVSVPMLRIDRATDGPQGAGLALDPDHDPLFRACVVDAGENSLGKPSGG